MARLAAGATRCPTTRWVQAELAERSLLRCLALLPAPALAMAWHPHCAGCMHGLLPLGRPCIANWAAAERPGSAASSLAIPWCHGHQPALYIPCPTSTGRRLHVRAPKGGCLAGGPARRCSMRPWQGAFRRPAFSSQVDSLCRECMHDAMHRLYAPRHVEVEWPGRQSSWLAAQNSASADCLV